MASQGARITETIRMSLEQQAERYISDVMNRYKQLGQDKKQLATNGVELIGSKKFKDALKIVLTDTANKALRQVRKEIPAKSEVKLNLKNSERLALYANEGEALELNEFSKLPTHIQVLVAKQADLLSNSASEELKNKIAFSFSTSETSTQDQRVIRQDLEDAAEDFISAGNMTAKGLNAASLVTNESRMTFFSEPEVLEEIHSFTFMNFDPKTVVCTELTNITIAANDVESMRYAPPLHHNCKSFLRANLKTSKGVDKLEISTWAPSAGAQKQITLNEGNKCC